MRRIPAIKAIFGMMKAMERERDLIFPPFRLDLLNERLWCGEQPISLRPKALAVLRYLAEHPQRLVTQEELLQAVWHQPYVSDGLLRGYIGELRGVLGDDAKAPRFIETAARRGYRFIAAVAPFKRSAPEWMPTEEMQKGDGGLVGREVPLQALYRHWARAAQGERQLVFVTGEPGLGKTALVNAFAESLPAGAAMIARGQCVEQLGETEAYRPLLEAVGLLCRENEQAVAHLRRYAPTWLIQMPWLLTEAARADLQRMTLGATRERMLREGVEFLETWSVENPLLLILEDLHWSDAASIELLALLARRDQAAPLLVLGTYRPIELVLHDHPLKALRHELRVHRLCAEIALELLCEADIGAYLQRRLPGQTWPERLPQALYQRTDGQPLFLVNVVEEGLNQGWLLNSPGQLDGLVPESLRQFLEQRLERLAPAERQVLEAGCVFGATFNAETVAAVCQEELLSIEECCTALARLGRFLRPADAPHSPERRAAGRYAFSHALYRDVLYHRIPLARRRHLHQRAGEALETSLDHRRALLAAELALHFEASRDCAKALSYLRLAADNAARRYANPEAIACLTRALELIEQLPESDLVDPRLDLLQQRAAVRRAMNDMRGAIDDLAAMLACARACRYPAREVGALIDLSRVYFWIDRRRALALAAEAVERSRTLDDPVMKTLADATHAGWSFYLVGWQDAHAEICRNALAAVRRLGNPPLLNTRLSFHTMLETYHSHYREASATADEGVQLAERLGDGYLVMLIRYFQIWSLLHLGEWGRAAGLLAGSLQVAERNGSPTGMRNFLILKALLHSEALDFSGAQALVEAAAPLLDSPPDVTSTTLFHIVSAKIALGLTDYPRAMEHLAAVRRQVEDEGLLIDWFFHLPFHQAFAEYWLAQGDPVQARHHAGRLCELAARPPERTYWALGQGLLGRIAWAREDPEEAHARMAEALRIVEGGEVPLAAWRIHKWAESLHRQAGNAAAAENCRGKAAGIVRKLAASLPDSEDAGADALRAAFLNAAPIRRILASAVNAD
ncbi:AAA family ATPase [Methyloterricola oryzae]|uniref:AAA family ATPase n=1 Tax=Methyloterricola oryzae TaxID=1495050 RepID=UPI0011AF3A60|nr:AAA family ATPase [Methyloterricola oryzae]